MWPFDIKRKQREAAEAKRREEHEASMKRIKDSLDRAERSRVIAAQQAGIYRVSAARQQQASYNPTFGQLQANASNDYLNPSSLTSPLNPIYSYEYAAPAHSSSHCSSSHSSHSSSDYGSSHSHSSHDHSCSSSYDSGSSSSSSDY